MWRGQEVGEVGPIEPLPEHVRREPYSLPQGFQWVSLSRWNVEELINFFKNNDSHDCIKHASNEYMVPLISYFLNYPSTRTEWQFGIQTTGGKLVGMILAVPIHICIGKEIKVFLLPTWGCHTKYQNMRLYYMLIKEIVRRANLTKVNQLILPQDIMFKPIATIIVWSYQFNQPTSGQLPSSPRTLGWRRMTSEDVPSALALINKWSSQFEIRQVYVSEEEIAYKLFQKHVITYVVEGKFNNVTDLVCCLFINDPPPSLHIIKVVSTQSPIKQLIIDAIVCARENGVSEVEINQYHIKSDILASLSFQPSRSVWLHFYNYSYHEISQTKFCFYV